MALVTGRGESQRAVISAVVVRDMERVSGERLCFPGTVTFSDAVQKHLGDTLLPILDTVTERLRLPRKCFEISGVNLGAASGREVGVRITGLSADLPIFMALLSQATGIPLRGNFVATGHIASLQGDVTTVEGIAAKLQAAIKDRSIERFIYPDPAEDASLEALSPCQRDRDITAVMAARDTIQTLAVSGIDELVAEVFTEEDIVLASLRQNFFDAPGPREDANDPVSRTVRHLTDNNERRFWNALQRYFSTGRCGQGQALLEAYTTCFLRRQRYPTALGSRLFGLICSVPPKIRRLKIKFPILDKALCAKLITLARDDDYDDVPLLLDAAGGRHLSHSNAALSPGERSVPGTPNSDSLVFDTITSMINEQALAQEVGIPLDSARGSYTLTSSTVQTYEEFLDTLQSFYVHLHRRTGGPPTEGLEATKARDEAIALLKRSFRRKGDDSVAFVRAKDGTEGGMRSVLDAMTEQLKAERQGAYVQRILKEAIDALDWDDRVAFMRGAMERLGPLLPPELKNEPVERFAPNGEVIAQTYVQALDRMGQLLRTL